MKKIIIIIILLTNIEFVSAKTFYSKYQEIEQLDQDCPKELCKTEIEKLYYLFKETNHLEYWKDDPQKEFSIKTGNIKIEESKWQEDQPNQEPRRKIEEKTEYHYQTIKPIRYLIFSNMIGGDDYFRIGEIEIFHKNKMISYIPLGKEEKLQTLLDNYYYEENANFTVEESFILELDQEYNPQDLQIKMYMYDQNKDIPKTWKIELKQELNKNTYLEANIKEEFYYNFHDEIRPFTYDINNFTIKDPEYQDSKISTDKIEENQTTKVEQKKLYKTIDEYDEWQIITRTYLEDYYTKEIEGYQIDLSTEKAQNHYYKRDKIELADKMIINNYQFNLEGFVKQKTTEIKITSNINPYRNGIYQINFITPFKTIKEQVIVNIEENYLNALKEQQKSLIEVEKKNQEFYHQINTLNRQIKELLKEKDTSINQIKKQLLTYQEINKILKQENQQLKNKKVEKPSIFNKKNMIFFLLTLIIFIIIKIVQKKSFQNKH